MAVRGRTDPLLERGDEERAIDAAVADASEGGLLALVEGPPGIGKTRLLACFDAQARAAGYHVLRARGLELEQASPLGLVEQLIEGAARRLNGGAHTAVRSMLESERGQATISFPRLNELYWFVADLAEPAPLALLVDDLQWADPASLRFVGYLAPRLGELPLLLVLARRVPGSGPDVERLVAWTTSLAEARVLRPGPLSRAAVRRLVEIRVGEAPAERFVTAATEATGGVPFLVEQLAGDLVARGLRPDADGACAIPNLAPERVGQSLTLRLAALPPAATTLAGAVAVLGGKADLHATAAVAGVPLTDAVPLLDRLVDTGVLAAGLPLDFAHPLLRQAAYYKLRDGERALAHAAAALYLHRRRARPLAIAPHLLLAPAVGEAWAVATLRAAATEATLASGPASAVAYLKCALARIDEPQERFAVLLELGRTHALIGATADAVACLEEARDVAGVPVDRVRAALELHRVLFLSGRPTDATRVARAELAHLDAVPRELSLSLHSALFTSLRAAPQQRPAKALVAEDLADLPGRSHGERELLAHLAFERTMATASAQEAADLALRALAGGALLEQAGPGALAVQTAAATLVLTDRLAEGASLLDEAVAMARRSANVEALAVDIGFRSGLRLARGDVLGAIDDAEHGLRIAREHDLGVAHAFALAFLADALMERGELAAVHAALRAAGMDGAIADRYPLHLVLARRGRLRARQNRYAAAVEDLREAGRRLVGIGRVSPLQSRWRSDCAMALRAVGDHDTARVLAEEELSLAAATGSARAIGAALTVAGTLAEPPGAIDRLSAAADTLRTIEAPLELARALVALGAAIRRSARPAQAREPLREAADLAARCHATWLAGQAMQELHLAGGRPRRIRTSGTEALTPGERRVAVMAVDGLTNREIAEALFLTVRTVENHLTAVYAKLGITSRSEVARAFGDELPPHV